MESVTLCDALRRIELHVGECIWNGTRLLQIERITLERESKPDPLHLAHLVYKDTKEPYCDHLRGFDELVDSVSRKQPGDPICESCAGDLLVAGKSKRTKDRPNKSEPLQAKPLKGPYTKWKRSGVSFVIVKKKFSRVTPRERERLQNFCTGLTSYAELHLQKADDGSQDIFLVEEEDSKKIVGFSIYVNHMLSLVMMPLVKMYPEKSLEWNQIRTSLEERRGVPDRVDPDEWTDVVVSLIEDERERLKERDSDSEENIREAVKTYITALKARMFSDSRLPGGIVDLIMNTAQDNPLDDEPFDPEVIDSDEQKAVLDLSLICVDGNWKKYGIARGLFRRLQYEVIKLSKLFNSAGAYIRLTSVDDAKPVYRLFGMLRNSMTDNTSYLSPNLLKTKLNIEDAAAEYEKSVTVENRFNIGPKFVPNTTKGGTTPYDRPPNENLSLYSWTRRGITFDINIKLASRITLDDEKMLLRFCRNMRDYFEKKFELARKNNKMIMLVRERSTGKLVGMTLYDLSVSKSRYRSKYYHEDPMRQEEAYLYDWVVENVPEAVNDDDKLDLMQFMDSMVTGVRNRNKTRDEHMIEMKGIFENPEIYKTELSPLPSLAHYAQTLALVIVGVALDGIPDYPHELEAVAYVDLVCSDPGWSGYGVSKGLFRHLTNMARILARANNLKQAYLRLEVATGDDDEPDDELVQLYESYGLMSEEPDSKYFTSPNLMEGDLKLDGSTPSEPVPEKQGLERPKNEQTTRDSWTRNGTTFDITLKQTEQITPQEERQMSAFCGNLSYWFDLTFEIEKTRRATMSLVTERNSKKIVGFCLYKMLLKQCPFTRKYREQYESDMERYDEAAYMYEWILDNIPEITDIDARTELAELLFNFYLNVSTSTRRTKEEWAKFYTDVFHDPSFIGTQLKKLPPLTKYVDSIVKLIVGVAVNGIPENYIREAELFIKLICSDEAWRGYGVSKGLFRHLVDLVKGAATQGNLRRATIRLDISRKHGEPNRKLVGMYRSYGMKSMKPGDEDETEYISPNLMEEDLTL